MPLRRFVSLTTAQDRDARMSSSFCRRPRLPARSPAGRTAARLALLLGVVLIVAPLEAEGQQNPLQGAWAADRYLLAGGEDHRVEGRIFFGERDWQVLFFVMEDGAPRRGSAEGGGYTLDGEALVFTHLYNLSVGEPMTGLPAQDLRMIVRSETDAPEEPTRIDVEGTVLTLHFPSGNRMTFRRR